MFKIFHSPIFELSGETDVGSAETQPIEGKSDRGCVKDVISGAPGHVASGASFFISLSLLGALIQTALGSHSDAAFRSATVASSGVPCAR